MHLGLIESLIKLKHLKYTVTSHARPKRSQIALSHQTFDSVRRGQVKTKPGEDALEEDQKQNSEQIPPESLNNTLICSGHGGVALA